MAAAISDHAVPVPAPAGVDVDAEPGGTETEGAPTLDLVDAAPDAATGSGEPAAGPDPLRHAIDVRKGSAQRGARRSALPRSRHLLD